MQYVCTGHPALLAGFCYTSVNNMTFLELPYCLLAHHPLVLKQGHKISFDVGAQNADYNNRARCIESKKKKRKEKLKMLLQLVVKQFHVMQMFSGQVVTRRKLKE